MRRESSRSSLNLRPRRAISAPTTPSRCNDFSSHNPNILREMMISSTPSSSDTVYINLDDIKRRLTNLRAKSNLPLRELIGEDSEDFQHLLQKTQMLYDTEAYPTYYSEIRSIFGDVNDVTPGTVGAYFGGCLASTNLPDKKCSVICAGSIPQPRGDNETATSDFCQYTVILATPEETPTGETLVFRKINDGEDKNTGIIYVNDKFTGFTAGEKEKLKQFGIPNFKVYRYSKDGRSYTDLTNGTGSIEDLPDRVNLLQTTPTTQTSSANTWIIILIVIFIIVALLIGWKIWKSRAM